MSAKRKKNAQPREGLFNLLTGESDRGTVLVAGEACSELLASMLERLFIEHPDVQELLGGASGVLGTFSARTRVCFALGLISKDERDDLQTIREMRNDAAHFRDGNVFSFAHDRTCDRCRSLRAKSPSYMARVETELGMRGEFIGKFIALHMALSTRRDAIRKAETPAEGRR
ncbi:MltR family transcriptional regulator [Sorangium cellulosum]|uniref:MltR family transcriptional regulator n=1 Tax=Sorangium cellulosum TaxID=56 RepID=UPI0012FF8741|nr:MltR family transcriptional regulator [Sorangium cellulosum]